MRMTGFEDYSKVQLHSLFSTDTWNNLDFSQKLNACQEVENRYALENGVVPCKVRHESMKGAIYGYQSGKTITLNTSLLREGVFKTEYRDANGKMQTAQIEAIAPGWNILDTVYHEGTHGIQEATDRMPYTYISSKTDRDLYRIQGIEKEAYAMGQSKTLDAISEVEQYMGRQDLSRNEYIEYIKMDSFDSALQNSIAHYNDLTIEQTLNNVIQDRDNGIVRTNSSASYNAINYLCDQHHYKSSVNMDLQDRSSTISILDGSSFFTEDSQSFSSSVNDGMNNTSGNYIDYGNSNNLSAGNDYGIG